MTVSKFDTIHSGARFDSFLNMNTCSATDRAEIFLNPKQPFLKDAKEQLMSWIARYLLATKGNYSDLFIYFCYSSTDVVREARSFIEETLQRPKSVLPQIQYQPQTTYFGDAQDEVDFDSMLVSHMEQFEQGQPDSLALHEPRTPLSNNTFITDSPITPIPLNFDNCSQSPAKSSLSSQSSQSSQYSSSPFLSFTHKG